MQTMYAVINGELHQLDLPNPDETVLPGITWGAFDEILTPAYWRGQAWQHSFLGTYSELRLGRTLSEEVAACLLGGYGMPAELALAAYDRLRDASLLHGAPGVVQIEQALSEPFELRGSNRRYRFARQKARYLSACLAQLSSLEVPRDDVDFRDRLAQLPGIGLKTASWIVRNFRYSSSVAIIDVHILRAGRAIGLFPNAWEPHRRYRDLEHYFLGFAKAVDVPAATLDSLIWDYMRRLSRPAQRPSPATHDQPDLFESKQIRHVS
jgi:thermostable 8-oxoguanine DNA glycosylase